MVRSLRGLRRGHSVGLVLFLTAGAAITAASVASMGQPQGPKVDQAGSDEAQDQAAAQTHIITGVTIRYVRENADHPAPEVLLDVSIDVSDSPEGMTAPQPGQLTRRVRLADLHLPENQRFTDQGLTLLAPAIFGKMKDLGFVGVYVTPDPYEFRVERGRVVDLREKGVTTATLLVTTGMVTELATVAMGERIPEDATIDHPIHTRIKVRSPIRPQSDRTETSTNLLRRDLLDDYIYRLNRHPGRRVDVAVSAPGEEPGAVRLEYLVTENRPWLLFAQLSNTGTASTDALREHFGFIHNDLSNNDDILTVGYQTANFQDVHSVYASYDRPLAGSDRVRWQVNSLFYTYVASEVGQNNADFEGDGWNVGGEIAWNFYQNRALFLDLVGTGRFEHINVQNNLAAIEGEDDFLIPGVALRLERNRDSDRINAQVGLEFNLAGIAGTDDDLDALGRFEADPDWYVLKGEATYSQFLEPLFSDDAEKNGSLAHELVFSARGQYAFDYRLIPNEQQPAGGLYTVRGYPEAIVAGDTVVMGSAEYRYHIARGLKPNATPGNLFGEPFRFSPQYQYGPTDWDLVLKAFVDVANVSNSDRQSFEADNNLVGAGIGVELSFTRRYSVRVDWGFALRDIHDGSGATTVESGDNELQFIFTAIY